MSDSPSPTDDPEAASDTDTDSATTTPAFVEELRTSIELVSPDELIPYENNPKEHPTWQIDKIASSIKNHGFDQPIVVDSGGEIIKGHGRQQAAKKLGLDAVPVVRREDLSAAQAKAARLADNKTHMDTGWETDSLALEIEQLTEQSGQFDEDLEAVTGFEEPELESLLEHDTVDIDEFFEAEVEAGADTTAGAGAGVDGEPDTEVVSCPECGHEFTVADDDQAPDTSP